VLCAAGLAAAVLLVGLESQRRHGLYWYEVRDNYHYGFAEGHAVYLPTPLSRRGIMLPEWDDRGQLAVLRLEISARLSGWWSEPCIWISSTGNTSRQCFERRAKGARYLLLPSDIAGSGAELNLVGEHLKWEEQTAEVLLFEPPALEGARVLILAPHPDDAEIAAFGLYSASHSYVVTMTAGNYIDGRYAGLHPEPAVQDRLRGEVRTWDSLVVPFWGGVPPERVVNLGYLTHSLPAFYKAQQAGSALAASWDDRPGQFRQGAIADLLGSREAVASWDSVVADLIAVLEAVDPDVIVAPHPALDAAPDHQYTTHALLEALAQLGDEKAVLLLYTNHHVWSEHYPFGPSDATITLPPWFGEGKFAGLYSHALDERAQLRKLFALGAMHDLRKPPMRASGGPARIFADRLGQALALVRRDPVGDYSYFRRAVRPNELFFVFPPAARNLLSDPAEQRY
jgi:LmbE family N-acetylglucosaminyl deacetylase